MSGARSPNMKDMSESIDFMFKVDGESSASLESFQGKEFAHTVTYISRGDYVPEKKQYPSFRKIFYEEEKFNPAVGNPNSTAAFDSFEKEQTAHWQRKGPIFNKQDRFAENRSFNVRGPVKPEEFPHVFEKGEKYFGRERKILPYLRAQLYTRPMPKCDEEKRQKALAPITIGPLTYDLGDYWRPKSHSTLGSPVRPSPCMASTVKREFDRGTGPGDANTCKKALMRPLLSSAPATLADSANNPLISTDRNKQEGSTHDEVHTDGGERRPRTPGGVMRRAVDDPFHLQGRNDYHFVRVKQIDGKTFILPVSNDDGTPIVGGNGSPNSPIIARTPSLDQTSLPGSQLALVETWGRPHSRAERECPSLLVEAVPLQKWHFAGSSSVELDEPRDAVNPNNRPKSNSSSTRKGLHSTGHSKSMSALTSSPIGKQRAVSPKPVSARRPTPNDTRSTPKQYPLPSPSLRSLSYEQQVKGRKFSAHVNSNPKSPLQVNLCVSDKVAIAPSSFANLESSVLPEYESSVLLARASERSQQILGCFNWGDKD